MRADSTTKNTGNEEREELQTLDSLGEYRGSVMRTATDTTFRILISFFQQLWNYLRDTFNRFVKPSGPGFYWRACAQRRGWLFDAAPPGSAHYYKLEGNHRDCRLQIETGISSVSSDTGGTIVQAYFPHALDEGLRIYPESESSREIPSRLRGDIMIGDKAFDDAFVVKGGSEDSVRRRLNPVVRDRLLKLWSTIEPSDQLDVYDDRISYQFPKFIENPEELMVLIDAMADVSDSIMDHKERIFIKSVGNAERCEICHKSDLFDAEHSYCRRCLHVSA